MKNLPSSIFKVCNLSFMIAMLLTIQSVQAQNYVTTFAGDGVVGLVDGDTLTARFNQPSDIDRDPFGNLFVVDMANVIRRITLAGNVETYAGTGVAGYLDGPRASAKFNGALNACVDSVGNVYVSDFQNQRIRKIDVNGDVTTIAGNGVAGYKDTTALESSFRYPRGICMDKQGNLYIADSWNHRIRKLDVNGNVTTFAGGGTAFGVQSIGSHADGSDTTARFWTPCGLEIDSAGNLYLADAYNHRIRKITPQGFVTTIAGSGNGGSANGGFLDGAINVARFNTPTGLGIDGQGNVFVADTYNNCIRYVSGGMVSTAGGSTTPGFVNGNSATALFDHPRTALMDNSGRYFLIPDGNNHVIRKLTLNLTVDISEGMTGEDQPWIYPNPAKDYFRIALPHPSPADEYDICIKDVSGRIVLEQSRHRIASFVDVQALPSGLYIVGITAEGQTSQVRFVKE